MDSHTSRRSRISVERTSTEEFVLPTRTLTSVDSRVWPRQTAKTPLSVYEDKTLCTCPFGTSRTNPTSSAKRAGVSSDKDPGRHTSMPQLPANAISRTVVMSPPSLTSCTDKRVFLASSRVWVTSNALTKRLGDSQSGTASYKEPFPM